MAQDSNGRLKTHWRRARRLTVALLALWFLVAVALFWFSRELQAVEVFGSPLGFFMAALGSPVLFLAITGGYAWRMARLDAAACAADGEGGE